MRTLFPEVPPPRPTPGPAPALQPGPFAGVALEQGIDRVLDYAIPPRLQPSPEHHLPLVMATCDRVHVMDSGRLLTTGTPAEIRRNPDVVTAYLGGHAR